MFNGVILPCKLLQQLVLQNIDNRYLTRNSSSG